MIMNLFLSILLVLSMALNIFMYSTRDARISDLAQEVYAQEVLINSLVEEHYKADRR